jgi:hypothetical protein
VNNGSFRILIPAVSNATNAKDGIPDAGGFDYGSVAPTVTCPASITGYTFSAGVPSPSAVTINGQAYHSFTCSYTGTGVNGQAFNTSGHQIVINSLINPAAKALHVEGTADTYKILVQNLDNSNAVIDQTVGSLAVVESVRITATVDPQITFRIAGVGAGASTCGLTTTVLTTSATVPFGSLSIGAFSVAAQTLSVSTNAVNGYAVTAMSNDSLGRAGNACHVAGGSLTGNPCIPDSPGDSGTMTYLVPNTWVTASNYGLGYTVGDGHSTTINTDFSGSKFLVFPEFVVTAQSTAPHLLFSGTGVVDNGNVNLCYQASIGPTQAAGDYTNNITYTATATF